jgi:hypothetical protein
LERLESAILQLRLLEGHDRTLARLGTLAEKYLAADPNTALVKLRQFGEVRRVKIPRFRYGIGAIPHFWPSETEVEE